jgi:diadenosine tetraphosphate (Ap4A) HIT family hydrolase
VKELSEVLSAFSDKFKIKDLNIFETDYWIWSLRPHQATLGAGILSLKRECATFGELRPEEYSDLHNMIKVIEMTLKELFSYDVINYLMLMMVDRQVHYHVIPRYKNGVELFGGIWKDSSWPGVPDLSGDSLDMEILLKISYYIKSNLKTY